jgi:hypothetical protein
VGKIRATMHRVYWMDGATPRTEPFASDALAAALAFAESLRRRRRDGEAVSFVTIVSEDPEQVGEGGVADPAPDYDWVKRRPAPRRSSS